MMCTTAVRLATILIVPLATVSYTAAQDTESRILSHGDVTALSVVPEPLARTPFPNLSERRNGDEHDPQPLSSSASGPLSGPAVTVTCSLAVVLGLFGCLVCLTRKFGNRSMTGGTIPSEVLQRLGSTAIDVRTKITMIRCGNRIVVMAQTPAGIFPISEIADAKEVQELTASCLGQSRREFASTLQSIEKERPAPGYLGTEGKAAPRASGQLFARA